jgi:hypothetical protein
MFSLRKVGEVEDEQEVRIKREARRRLLSAALTEFLKNSLNLIII